MTKEQIEARFFSNVEYSEDCWNWTASKNRGYGMFQDNGKRYYSHRWVYQEFIGKLEKGKMICHECDNPSCVNPFHLFQGTHTDNMRDALKKKRLSHQTGTHAALRKTHCVNGHEFTKDNLRIIKSKHRNCKKCYQVNMKKLTDKRKLDKDFAEKRKEYNGRYREKLHDRASNKSV